MLGDIQIKRFFVAGSGRGLKKGRSSVAGGRGPHSQRMTSYQPPPPQQQAPVAHRFQVTASDSSGRRGKPRGEGGQGRGVEWVDD